MAIVQGWLPPTREHYETILLFWQLGFPLIASAQWVVKWAPMGKTSTPSIFNVPGKPAWMTMELVGPLALVYVMRGLLSAAAWDALAWQNKVLAGLYLLHYAYRAVLYPLLQPSMAPIHLAVWLCAVLFQLCNATCLAAWLAAYSAAGAGASVWRFAAGVGVFGAGLAGNYLHDEELRRMRRGPGAVGRGRYRVPTGGLFRAVLYPHYLCEWVEWLGFWVAAGGVPARVFLQNEVLAMLPRAVNGRRWYVERFGEEKLGGRRAILPGLL